MAGRFFVSPFFMAVFLVYYVLSEVHWGWLLLLACLLLAEGHSRRQYDKTHAYNSDHEIYDERAFYAHKQALFKNGGFLSNILNGNFGSKAGIRSVMRNRPPDTQGVPRQWQLPQHFNERKRVVETGYIGVWGYSEGPGRITIDPLALTDPLLARLPTKKNMWHIGHFTRHIPKGYIRARKIGDTSGMQSDIRNYYEKLRIITSDDLFNWDRLETIIRFNCGEYEYWRNSYLHSRLP